LHGLKRAGLLKFLLSASHPLRITLTLFTSIHTSLEAEQKITKYNFCFCALPAQFALTNTMLYLHRQTFSGKDNSQKVPFIAVFESFSDECKKQD